MSLYLNIDPRNGYPVFLQIVEQVRRAVAIGALKPGEQLPPGKRLAAQLLVNPATVSRAIRELEYLGIVETFPGRGTFVTATGDGAAVQGSASDVVAKQFESAAREASVLGISESEVHALAKEAITRIFESARPREEV